MNPKASHQPSNSPVKTQLLENFGDELEPVIEEADKGRASLNFLAKVESDEKEENGGASLTFAQDGKPNLSYAELIKRAIHSSLSQKMTLNEIYKWITDNFPYYRDQESTSWKNSIRHNLSLNKQFKKVQRERGDPGKGSYWRIDTSSRDTWRARRPRSFGHANTCPCHAGSEEHRCVSTTSMGRCSSGANTPRINPVIQALFGMGDPQQQQQQPATSMAQAEPEEYRQQQSLGSPPGSQSHSSADVYGTSWGSQTSSVPSNFRFAELDSSFGSVQSQLSESFKNLYQQALNASFNNSSMAFQSQPGTSLATQQDPMLNSHVHGSVTGYNPPGPSNQQFMGGFHPAEGPEQVQQGTSGFSSGMISLKDRAAVDWFHKAAAAESQGRPPPPPTEVFPNLDMDQFQNMMGSMQSRDLQELLGNYSDDLAASWKDFLSRSIGGGFNASQSQTQAQIWKQWQAASQSRPLPDPAALAPTPPAVTDINMPGGSGTESLSFTTPKDLEQFGLIPDPVDNSQASTGMSRKHNPLLSSVKEEDENDISQQTMSTPPLSVGNPNYAKEEMGPDDDSGSDFDWEDLVNRD